MYPYDMRQCLLFTGQMDKECTYIYSHSAKSVPVVHYFIVLVSLALDTYLDSRGVSKAHSQELEQLKLVGRLKSCFGDVYRGRRSCICHCSDWL